MGISNSKEVNCTNMCAETVCIKYFSFGCDKIPDKKYVRKEKFILIHNLKRDTVCNSRKI